MLVLVPESLIGQWEDELAADKFDVQGLNGGYVDVASHVSAVEIVRADASSINLLVIDEAHRLTDGQAAAESLRGGRSARGPGPVTPVALPATPVRSNEALFLRLLHLLDPLTYRLDQLDAFRRRVDHREQIANAVALLAEGTPPFLMAEAVEEAPGLFADDAELDGLLRALSSAIAADEEEAQRCARRVRSYVSETYRIHRRLIRTRRNERLQSEFPVRGPVRGEPWALTVRICAGRRSSRRSTDFARGSRMRTGSISRCCTSSRHGAVPRRRQCRGSATRSAQEAEDDLMVEEVAPLRALRSHGGRGESLAADLRSALARGRDRRPDRAMADWAWTHVNKRTVAACSSFTSVARVAANRMVERYGAHRVTALLSDMWPGIWNANCSVPAPRMPACSWSPMQWRRRA